MHVGIFSNSNMLENLTYLTESLVLLFWFKMCNWVNNLDFLFKIDMLPRLYTLLRF